jgi:hypothetical protein
LKICKVYSINLTEYSSFKRKLFNGGLPFDSETSVGNLQIISNELVLNILGLLGGNHLGVLATVSKSFYVFANHEPLWSYLNGGFLYNGSWSSTYVAAYSSFDISGVRTRGTLITFSRFVASPKTNAKFETDKHNGLLSF